MKKKISIKSKLILFFLLCCATFIGAPFVPVSTELRVLLRAAAVVFGAAVLIDVLLIKFVWKGKGGIIVDTSTRLGQLVLYVATLGGLKDIKRMSSCRFIFSTTILLLLPLGVALTTCLSMLMLVSGKINWDVIILTVLICIVVFALFSSNRNKAMPAVCNVFIVIIIIRIAIYFYYELNSSFIMTIVYVGLACTALCLLTLVLGFFGLRGRGFEQTADNNSLNKLLEQKTAEKASEKGSSVTQEVPVEETFIERCLCPTIEVQKNIGVVDKRGSEVISFLVYGSILLLLAIWAFCFTFTDPVNQVSEATTFEGRQISGKVVLRYLPDGGVEGWRTHNGKVFRYRHWATVEDYENDVLDGNTTGDRIDIQIRLPIDETDTSPEINTVPGSPQDGILQAQWQAVQEELRNDSFLNRRIDTLSVREF